MSEQRKINFIYFLTFLLLLFLIIIGILFYKNPKIFYQFSNEKGFIEQGTNFLYLICLIFILLKGGFKYFKKNYYFIMIPLLFALRELDFDKRFTTHGILSTKLYFSAHVSLLEKGISFIIVLSIMICLIILIKDHFRTFLKGLKKGSPISLGVFYTLSLAVTAKLLDGFERKTKAFNLTFSDSFIKSANIIEEVLELGIPIFIIIIFYYYFNSTKKQIK